MVIIHVNNSVSYLEGVKSQINNELHYKLSYRLKGLRHTKLPSWAGWTRLYDRKTCSFPTGLGRKVIEVLKENKEEYRINDCRVKYDEDDKIYFKFKEAIPELRYYQKEAIEVACKRGRGVIEMATGTGKSLTAIGIIKKIGRPTLYVVPKASILNQTVEVFKSFFHDKHIGVITGNKKQFDKDITIATFQSLPRVEKEFFDKKDVILIDEFHHCLHSGTKIRCGLENKEYKISNLYKKFKRHRSILPEVRGWDGEKWVFRKIVNFFRYESPSRILCIRVKKSDGSRTELKVTDKHKIYTRDKGKVMSGDLVVGDKVLLGDYNYININGELLIGEVYGIDEIEVNCKYVYDFEVEEVHNYIANGILVSNSAAKTYQELNENKFNNIYARIGLTATNTRSAGDDLALQGVLSTTIYKYPFSKAVEDGYLVNPHFVVNNFNHPKINHGKKPKWKKEYQELIIEGEEYNTRIAKIAQKLQEKKISTLIFVEEIAQGEYLNDLISDSYFIHGNKKTKESQKLISDFNNRKIFTLIGTRVIGEGVDTVSAHYCIMAGSVKSEIDVIQRVGRMLRLHESKNKAVVIDFMHRNTIFLRHQSNKRIKLYKEYFNGEVLWQN